MVWNMVLRDLLFADDCALMDSLKVICKILWMTLPELPPVSEFGLTISIKKTEVLHQPKPGDPVITINSRRRLKSFAILEDSCHKMSGSMTINLNNSTCDASVKSAVYPGKTRYLIPKSLSVAT